MSWDTVQDAYLMHWVPLQLFGQHNPCYTSLLIFSAGLQANLTLLLHLGVPLCITSALCHHSLKVKSALLQLTLQLSHEIYFLQWFQVKPVEKFLSPIVEGSSEKPTACQFSLPLLVWSPLGVSVNGMKNNPLIYYTEAFVWYRLLNILLMKKSKSTKLINVFIERIQLRLQKKCVANTCTDVVHAGLLQPTERCLLHCSLHSHDEMLHSLVQKD